MGQGSTCQGIISGFKGHSSILHHDSLDRECSRVKGCMAAASSGLLLLAWLLLVPLPQTVMPRTMVTIACVWAWEGG